MPGVTIGDNVVIGAKSLVNSDIPSIYVALGIPAKVIRPLDVDELRKQRRS
jgi:acetyltransferase-like isoleucine patch superfamily enzyme